MKKDVQAELNTLKIEEPAIAKVYQQDLFGKSDLDEPLDVDPEAIVKYYPGSPKGPRPEDDPKHYTAWFMRNHPNDAIYGKNTNPDYREIGGRWKYVYNAK
jgi:hypothetical protein